MTYRFEYTALHGNESEKAVRLASYCLGRYATNSIPPFDDDIDYTYYPSGKPAVLRCEVGNGSTSILTKVDKKVSQKPDMDQKRVIDAWIRQRAAIPGSSRFWLVRGDGAGNFTNPSKGVHLGMARSMRHRHIVLVPGANRDRYLGPRLAQQMKEMRAAWVPWEEKADTVWWAGAATGPASGNPRILSRYRFLDYYGKNPTEKVVVHAVLYRRWREPSHPPPKGRFDKRAAFRHKCPVLLKGNDVPSGLSWYFCGNSVVLMQAPPLDHILYFEMKPWEHYVPLESDPADVLVKLQWVLDNQHEAREIVKRAHEHLSWFTGDEYLWACNEVLRRVSERPL